MSANAQSDAADAQASHNRAITAARRRYAREVEAWQNEQYNNELAYVEDILDYRENEFERYKVWREKVEGNVQQNYFGKLATTMARMTEEAIATELANMSYQQQGQDQRAQVTTGAAERGVRGNSVQALLGEIERQESTAITQNTMSNEATQRQLERQMEGYEAEAESTLLNLPRLSFEPIQMPNEPAPVNPVEPAPPVSRPSMLGAGLSIIGQGISTYAQYSN
jgi:hypothetical protein